MLRLLQNCMLSAQASGDKVLSKSEIELALTEQKEQTPTPTSIPAANVADAQAAISAPRAPAIA
jgi:hypothetical protein